MKFPLFWWPLSHFESIGCDFFKVEFKKNYDNKIDGYENYEKFLTHSLDCPFDTGKQWQATDS